MFLIRNSIDASAHVKKFEKEIEIVFFDAEKFVNNATVFT